MGRLIQTIRVLAFSGVFLLAGWVLPAFSSPLLLEYSLGFNGRFKINSWTPVTVTVENRGKNTAGTLEVLVSSGSEYYGSVYQSRYSLELTLPYGSKKRCTFIVLIESITHDLVIRFRRGDKTLSSRTQNLKTQVTEKDLVGVLVDGVYPEVLSALPATLSPVHLHERYLPERWYGYDGVRTLIIEAVKLSRLTDPQQTALDRWIRLGGSLVVFGSLNTGTLMDGSIQRLLPMDVRGLKRLDRLTAFSALTGFKGMAVTPFLVSHVDVHDAEVRVKEGDIPLVSERMHGNGSIVFLAFDPQSPPFARLVSRPGFWQKISPPPPARVPDSVLLQDQSVLQALLAAARLYRPRFWQTLAAIILYLSLLWVWVRRPAIDKWKRIRYLLLTILAFSIAGFGYFYRVSQNDASFNSFGHIHLNEKRIRASGRYYIGLYSIGNEAYDLSFTEAAIPLTHILYQHSNKKVPDPYRNRQIGRFDHLLGVSGKWSHQFFSGNLGLEFPMTIQVGADDTTITLAIENPTPYVIEDCLLYYKQRVYAMENVMPGIDEKQIISTAAGNRLVPPLPGKLRSVSVPEATGVQTYPGVIKLVLGAELQAAAGALGGLAADTACFIGWVKSDLLKPDFEQKEFSGSGITVISWTGRVGPA